MCATLTLHPRFRRARSTVLYLYLNNKLRSPGPINPLRLGPDSAMRGQSRIATGVHRRSEEPAKLRVLRTKNVARLFAAVRSGRRTTGVRASGSDAAEKVPVEASYRRARAASVVGRGTRPEGDCRRSLQGVFWPPQGASAQGWGLPWPPRFTGFSSSPCPCSSRSAGWCWSNASSPRRFVGSRTTSQGSSTPWSASSTPFSSRSWLSPPGRSTRRPRRRLAPRPTSSPRSSGSPTGSRKTSSVAFRTSPDPTGRWSSRRSGP